MRRESLWIHSSVQKIGAVQKVILASKQTPGTSQLEKAVNAKYTLYSMMIDI